MSRDPLAEPPVDDGDIAGWSAALGLAGLVTQLRALAGWAGADDRLGIPFLRAVLHDNPARLLGLDPPAG